MFTINIYIIAWQLLEWGVNGGGMSLRPKKGRVTVSIIRVPPPTRVLNGCTMMQLVTCLIDSAWNKPGDLIYKLYIYRHNMMHGQTFDGKS